MIEVTTEHDGGDIGMSQETLGKTYLSVSELPEWKRDHYQKFSEQIAAYLRQVIEAHKECETSYIELPSLNKLSGFLHCSHLDIYEALEILSMEGVSHRFLDMDSLLAVWCD